MSSIHEWAHPYSRKRSAWQSPSSTTASNFLAESLQAITKKLDFGRKHNDGINWLPNKLSLLSIPTIKSHGTNNTHYVIPRISAHLLGRSETLADKTGWQDVENEAQIQFGLHQKQASKTRNIDYWRDFKEKGNDYTQAVEVKKTTGSYKDPPVFIRSSRKQLEALASQKNPEDNQIHPSIYIVGSTDFDHTNKKWIITWWCIPVKDVTDFMLINTSDYRWLAPATRTEIDGWVTRL
jgi:hypothetical protein